LKKDDDWVTKRYCGGWGATRRSRKTWKGVMDKDMNDLNIKLSNGTDLSKWGKWFKRELEQQKQCQWCRELNMHCTFLMLLTQVNLNLRAVKGVLFLFWPLGWKNEWMKKCIDY